MEHYITNMLKYVTEKSGFYVEVGANDGVTQSYTYELENIGWHGMLIEPSLEAFDKCVKNRPNNKLFNCALVASENTKEISGDFYGSFLASVGGERLNKRDNVIGNIIAVPARTLNSILEELKLEGINLLSLDVEGYEYEVLKGFDISKYHPKYVIIEVYDKIKADIFRYMTFNGYWVADNLTMYNHGEYPCWDGTCNDYLFVRK